MISSLLFCTNYFIVINMYMSLNKFRYQRNSRRQYNTQNYEMAKNIPQVRFFGKILCQPKQNAAVTTCEAKRTAGSKIMSQLLSKIMSMRTPL